MKAGPEYYIFSERVLAYCPFTPGSKIDETPFEVEGASGQIYIVTIRMKNRRIIIRKKEEGL